MTDRLSGGVVQPTDAQVHNPWRESLENCITGDNYLRSTEWHQLIEELDRLYAIEVLAVPQAPLQAEPVPVVASDRHVRAVLLSYHSNNLTEEEAVRLLATPQAEPAVAYMTPDEDGSPSMLFFDRKEALTYCDDGEAPIELVARASQSTEEVEGAQAEPAVAEQAREVESGPMHASVIKRIWKECRERDMDYVYFAWKIEERVRAALASQSTPPPESAAGTIKYCCYAAYCEAGHSPDCAILAANPTAQPDGGSKA